MTLTDCFYLYHFTIILIPHFICPHYHNPNIQRLVAGGRGLNVKMDLDHCSRLKIDSDCGRGSGVPPANFWSRVAILLTFFCSSPSRYKQCHGSATNFRFLITVNHWTWQFICGNVTFGLLHSQQNVMQQCNMLQNVTCPLPRHQNMLPCSMVRSFSVFLVLVWLSPILHDHGLLAVCAFIRVLQFLHWSKSIYTIWGEGTF